MKKIILILSIALLFITGCGKKSESSDNAKKTINSGDPIIVSTMNDPEGEILGRMMVMALRDAGYEITDNTYGYTGTANGRKALLEGETGIYMDYTGRGLRLIEGVDEKLYHELDTAFEDVAKWDKEHNKLIWMTYAPFNNTDAVAVTKEFAEKNKVYSMEDFARYVNEGGKVKMLVHEYWVTLPTGLPGMEKAYGFKLKEGDYIIGTSNAEQILHEGTDGVNAIMLYSSSGLVPEYELHVLEDPKKVSPVYSPAPIIREEILQKYPGVQEVLDKVFKSITLEEMVKMNAELQSEGKSGQEIAEKYLLSKGLIKKDEK